MANPLWSTTPKGGGNLDLPQSEGYTDDFSPAPVPADVNILILTFPFTDK